MREIVLDCCAYRFVSFLTLSYFQFSHQLSVIQELSPVFSCDLWICDFQKQWCSNLFKSVKNWKLKIECSYGVKKYLTMFEDSVLRLCDKVRLVLIFLVFSSNLSSSKIWIFWYHAFFCKISEKRYPKLEERLEVGGTCRRDHLWANNSWKIVNLTKKNPLKSKIASLPVLYVVIEKKYRPFLSTKSTYLVWYCWLEFLDSELNSLLWPHLVKK